MGGLIVGREVELAEVDRLLVAAREGLRGLLFEGEPGIGKTTVMREVTRTAAQAGFRVLSVTAAEREKRLSFAGLTDLLAPIRAEDLAKLPHPQRQGLEVALLRVQPSAQATNPRTIGTGLVTLLAMIADEGPLLLTVDDLQWLDQPTVRALEFALRRLEASPVAVFATLRTGGGGEQPSLLANIAADRMRRLALTPLDRDALSALLSSELGPMLTRPLLGRLERASRGNPLYALELARAVKAEGKPPVGRDLPVPHVILDLVAKRLRRLPVRAQEELLRASALAHPTSSTIDLVRLAPAIEAGIISVREDDHLEFAHPLFARAAFATIAAGRRRRIHAQLAAVVPDIEERAWHLSEASGRPHSRIAAILDQAAQQAHARGAPEIAADLQEQAAARTPLRMARPRSVRLLRAAQHHFKAGDRERAKALSQEIISAHPGSQVRGAALHLLAEITFLESPASAIPLLEAALATVSDDARRAELETSLGFGALVTLDIARARDCLERAIGLAESTGDFALLSEAIAMQEMSSFLSGLGVDDAALMRALALEDTDREVPFQRRPSLMVAQLYEYTGRIKASRDLLVKIREQVISRGEESDLPYVLVHLAVTSWLAGDLANAEREADEALQVSALTDQEVARAFCHVVRSPIRALRGDLDAAAADAALALALSERTGWWGGVMQARWSLSFVASSRDDAAAGLEVLEPILAMVAELGVYEWPFAMVIPEAIEALVANGELARASDLIEAFEDSARASDRPWALALSARSRGLLQARQGQLQDAETSLERAVVEHERLPIPFELGRTLLVLGQTQRRAGHRRKARQSLLHARATFEAMGAPLWVERAVAEARRIGVRGAPSELTTSERLVAERAASGLTNREIAAQLFMSRRTVEATLARAYAKLDVHSRAELGAWMARRDESSGDATTTQGLQGQ